MRARGYVCMAVTNVSVGWTDGAGVQNDAQIPHHSGTRISLTNTLRLSEQKAATSVSASARTSYTSRNALKRPKNSSGFAFVGSCVVKGQVSYDVYARG